MGQQQLPGGGSVAGAPLPIVDTFNLPGPAIGPSVGDIAGKGGKPVQGSNTAGLPGGLPNGISNTTGARLNQPGAPAAQPNRPPGGDISGISFLRDDPILNALGQAGIGPGDVLYNQRRRELADINNPGREIRGPSADDFASNVARRNEQGNGFASLFGGGQFPVAPSGLALMAGLNAKGGGATGGGGSMGGGAFSPFSSSIQNGDLFGR